METSPDDSSRCHRSRVVKVERHRVLVEVGIREVVFVAVAEQRLIANSQYVDLPRNRLNFRVSDCSRKYSAWKLEQRACMLRLHGGRDEDRFLNGSDCCGGVVRFFRGLEPTDRGGLP